MAIFYQDFTMFGILMTQIDESNIIHTEQKESCTSICRSLSSISFLPG